MIKKRKYPDFTRGQEESLLNKLAADTGLEGVEAAKAYIGGKFKLVPVVAEVKKVAGSEGEFLTAASIFGLDPITIGRDVFFRQSNIWRSDEFWHKIGQHISSEVSLGLAGVSRQTTKKYAYDSQIRKELRGDHIFTPDEFAAIVASLIAKQPNGQKGALLNTSYANLFYVEVNGRVLVAHVIWHSVGGEWRFFVSALDEPGEWDYGNYVFSRN
jgi:hypothetical protein